jgi:hypothetical protein
VVSKQKNHIRDQSLSTDILKTAQRNEFTHISIVFQYMIDRSVLFFTAGGALFGADRGVISSFLKSAFVKALQPKSFKF